MPEKPGLLTGSPGGLSLAHLRPCRALALREEVAATTRGHPCPQGALRDRARHIQTPPQLRAEGNKQQARGKEGTELGAAPGAPPGERCPRQAPPDPPATAHPAGDKEKRLPPPSASPEGRDGAGAGSGPAGRARCEPRSPGRAPSGPPLPRGLAAALPGRVSATPPPPPPLWAVRGARPRGGSRHQSAQPSPGIGSASARPSPGTARHQLGPAPAPSQIGSAQPQCGRKSARASHGWPGRGARGAGSRSGRGDDSGTGGEIRRGKGRRTREGKAWVTEGWTQGKDRRRGEKKRETEGGKRKEK